jgi:succinylglutamate desuccinylase
VYVIDLHTTSGDSPPFGTIGDTIRNRDFALRFPVPIVLGLEEHLDGTLLEYMNNMGHITMGFESGQHGDPGSIERAEDCVWMALAATGILLDPATVAHVNRARDRLEAATRSYPRVLEVRYRHAADPEHRFTMAEGYASFQPVTAGTRLAEDRAGPVVSPESGRVLMPLYQPQGDDGFFIMREFRPLWLHVSALMRHLRMDAALHWLPGVRRDREHRDTLYVDTRTARWFALQFFHLLGYRKRRMEGDVLVVSRRRHDRA